MIWMIWTDVVGDESRQYYNNEIGAGTVVVAGAGSGAAIGAGQKKCIIMALIIIFTI